MMLFLSALVLLLVLDAKYISLMKHFNVSNTASLDYACVIGVSKFAFHLMRCKKAAAVQLYHLKIGCVRNFPW